MRIRIDASYDGTDFKGWARQPGLRTVQETLELALATALRVPSVRATCAGRTDAGVHARGQVVHADLESGDLDEKLARRLNGILPADLRVRRVVAAPEGFDARFSAVWRRYAYRISDGPPDPLTRNHVLAWGRPLDVDAMNAASRDLLGLHDFAAFCKKREGATTIRTLLDLSWERVDGVIVGTVRADAFCHSMVRSLVGCLIAIGEGRQSVGWAAEVLSGQDRRSVTVVHPHGLTLEEVGYPADELLAAQAAGARKVRTL